jgi:hypothetical protein
LAYYLSTPRRRFVMWLGANQFLDVFPGSREPGGSIPTPGSQLDVDNGPKPTFEILQVIGDKSCHVRFSVKLAIHPCHSINAGGITSFEFVCGDEIEGDTLLTTRRYEGVLRVATRNFNPHALRAIRVFIPPIQPGFKRQRVFYQTSSDGLELHFAMIDQEQYANPPFPATNFEMEYSLASSAYFVQTDAEIRLSLSAPKDVSKLALHNLARRIIASKLHVDDIGRGGSLYPVLLTQNESYKRNQVDWVARVRAFPWEQTGPFGMMKDELGKPLVLPGYNSEQPPAAAHITATPAGLFVSMLQTACNPRSPFPAFTQGQGTPGSNGQGPEIGQGGGNGGQGVLDQLPSSQTYIDQSVNRAGAYVIYTCSSELRIDRGVLAFPVGKSSTGAVASSPPAIVKMHQGYAQRIVRIEAERLLLWPDLPKPVNFTDDNMVEHTLLNWYPMPDAMRLAADGSKSLFSIGAEYHYALSKVPDEKSGFSVGHLPYITPLGKPYRFYPPHHFVDPKTILS